MAKSSIKEVGEKLEQLSNMRKENPAFNAKDFLEFAKAHKDKYSLIESGEDLLVSTWYYDDLVRDYEASIQP